MTAVPRRKTLWVIVPVATKEWAWRVERGDEVREGTETTEGKAYTAADIALDELINNE